MNNLAQTEWLKIKKYRAFWWLTGITALSYPGINYIFYSVYKELTSKSNEAGQLAKAVIGNPFTFPEVWHTVAYFSSWFIFIPAVLVIMFVTNEYTFKTHRQNVIDGWSRKNFMAAKMIDVLITSAVITVLYFAVSLVTGFLNTDKGGGSPWSQFYYVGLFALQTFSQLSIAFLIGFLVRRAFISLGIFLFYFIILEPILVGLAKFKANDIGRFLPLEISDRMIPIPAFLGKIDKEAYEKSVAAINTHILLTIGITVIVWLICYRVNSKRDL
jgi:ABC-type transport system involved in multi-copper enzyme maturation permease subunit